MTALELLQKAIDEAADVVLRADDLHRRLERAHAVLLKEQTQTEEYNRYLREFTKI